MLLLCRMVILSSTNHLDDTKQHIEPNTSVDPVIPETSIESLQPVQDADSSLNIGDSPKEHLDTTTDATKVLDSSGKLQPETPEDTFPDTYVSASVVISIELIACMVFNILMFSHT